ncbi:MAG: hypothetical protein ACI8P3_003025, partial [Saprospiraceae bacterium]
VYGLSVRRYCETVIPCTVIPLHLFSLNILIRSGP